MKDKEIIARIAAIKQHSVDAEMAHALEDELYLDFISGLGNANEATIKRQYKIVLRAREIKFSRWAA